MGNCEPGEIKTKPCGHRGEGPPSAERQREEKEQLGKCRNIARLEKDLGLRLRGIRSLTVGLSSGASSLFPHLERRGASPGCGGRSEAQSTAGESGSLESCVIVWNLPVSATSGWSGWAKGTV